jgi:hypothetical protein
VSLRGITWSSSALEYLSDKLAGLPITCTTARKNTCSTLPHNLSLSFLFFLSLFLLSLFPFFWGGGGVELSVLGGKLPPTGWNPSSCIKLCYNHSFMTQLKCKSHSEKWWDKQLHNVLLFNTLATFILKVYKQSWNKLLHVHDSYDTWLPQI